MVTRVVLGEIVKPASRKPLSTKRPASPKWCWMRETGPNMRCTRSSTHSLVWTMVYFEWAVSSRL